MSLNSQVIKLVCVLLKLALLSLDHYKLMKY